VFDVEHAKLRGFVTIQYTGVVDRGHSDKADLIINRWADFPQVE
jgi:hypothetical protein